MLNVFYITLYSLLSIAFLDSDPNFYIYLALGQSNMEGTSAIEGQDIQNILERFKMMPAIDMPSKGRLKQNWYSAIPPLCRENNGLGIVDYFEEN